jgi:ABC-type multidrug transport system ATPase subunit
MRVELDKVSKSFGRVRALHEITLDLPSGSRTALIGPNGSGKSTLARVLMGMLDAVGEVRLGGRSPAAERAALARRIAYVPQIAPRLAAPVRELVAAIARLRDIPLARVESLAAELSLDLRALARRPFRALSGGMRQKVLAALALASCADLLLLDEPTASMDAGSRAAFFRLVEALPGRPTVVLCSHRLDEIRRLVEHVVVLADGQLVWHGLAADYLAEHALAVVEVAVATDAASAWLADRGFQPGNVGWWSRTVPTGLRAGLVADVVRDLNGQVRDVLARDVERLDPPAATPRSEP